jgi:hypothetical protein
MTRETVHPVTNERGEESHPAFSLISASRISYGGGGGVLFDSDITHQHTVRIKIETATRQRRLNHDYIHGHKQLIEVELSEAQWASFVSSMNTTGVPATLRWLPGEGQLPELPYAPRLQQSMDEVRNVAERLFTEAREALAEYEQAVAEKAGAKVVREKLRNLHATLENSKSNVTYAAKSLNEHTENVVQKARADIEAIVYHESQRLGLDAGQSKMLELPMLEGEVKK